MATPQAGGWQDLVFRLWGYGFKQQVVELVIKLIRKSPYFSWSLALKSNLKIA